MAWECCYNQNLEDLFIQRWNAELSISSKGVIYHTFKTQFCYNDYLNVIENYENLFV